MEANHRRYLYLAIIIPLLTVFLTVLGLRLFPNAMKSQIDLIPNTEPVKPTPAAPGRTS